MNWKKYAIAVVVVFVVTLTAGFTIHATLLAADYKNLGPVMRSEEDSAAYFPFMLLGQFLFSVAIVWIYAQGVEAKPWLGQGVRFGLAVWLARSVSGYLIYYAVQPLPENLVIKQIAFQLIADLVLGVAIAAIYRK